MDFLKAVGKVMLGIVVLALLVVSVFVMIFGAVMTGQTGNAVWLFLTPVGLALTAIFFVILSEVMF